jgi:glycosyltransferase involved in cell wall biosynthesis
LRPVPGHGFTHLRQILSETRPQVILWNVGLTSLLYQDFRLWPGAANIGVFTSPLYSLGKLARLGPVKLVRHRSLTAVHLLGSLLPKGYLRARLQRSGLRLLVTQTRTTRDQLRQAGLWPGRIEVIPPGVDEAWQAPFPAERLLARQELGFSPNDCVVVYFGSPAPLRGLPLLVQAVALARRQNPAIKLLVLSRRRPGELRSQDGFLSQLSGPGPGGSWLRLLDGYMDKTSLVRGVAAGDIAALPFELVPSDAPLSLLEAQALGLPLVTTRAACLPELSARGAHYLADPGDPPSLTQALLQASHDLRPAAENLARRGWREMEEAWTLLVQSL